MKAASVFPHSLIFILHFFPFSSLLILSLTNCIPSLFIQINSFQALNHGEEKRDWAINHDERMNEFLTHDLSPFLSQLPFFLCFNFLLFNFNSLFEKENNENKEYFLFISFSQLTVDRKIENFFSHDNIFKVRLSFVLVTFRFRTKEVKIQVREI